MAEKAKIIVVSDICNFQFNTQKSSILNGKYQLAAAVLYANLVHNIKILHFSAIQI